MQNRNPSSRSKTQRPALTPELRRIWQGSYNLCLKTAHLDEDRARRFADATIQGIFEADQALAAA